MPLHNLANPAILFVFAVIIRLTSIYGIVCKLFFSILSFSQQGKSVLLATAIFIQYDTY